MAEGILYYLFAVSVVFLFIFRLFRGKGKLSSGGRSYGRIRLWIRKRYNTSFKKEDDAGYIRMQLESILKRERERLQADYVKNKEKYEAERKKKRWRKPFDVEKRVKGFKAFIEKQDYAILTK